MRLSRLLSWPRRRWLRFPLWIVALVVIWSVGRFAVNLVLPYNPTPITEVPFLEHARTKTSGKTRVTVSALGAEESYEVFGAPLALQGIQPVWVEIENGETVPL